MHPNDRPLLAAAHQGDTSAVRGALAACAHVESRDDEGRTPLLPAARADRVDVAELLIAAGADPNARDTAGDTPWLAPGLTGSMPMLRALLPAGPDLSLTNRFGGTSLIPAAERGHVAYVRAVLRETGTGVDHVNRLGWTALLEAVILGDGGRAHQDTVELLITAGADPLFADHDGTTPLQHASRRGRDAIAGLPAATTRRVSAR
ncbi:ankyrin repeat domain-containing protein [Streptomyces sp. NPDC008121]|uniref:ankyrin repeat domain-containing protein n=1 Tax=Streptomyces sp. NPDC008121 TaxID=3364809 RepID=UPI0036EA59AD